MDLFTKRGGWGFNFLHQQALLNENQDFDKFKSVSVTKKPIGNMTITPIHMACINPNPKYVKNLLEIKAEYSIGDANGRRPIHYAAACSGGTICD